MPSTRKLSAQQCPQCTAPLTIGPNDTEVKCLYCGNSIRIERAKPPAPTFQAPSVHTLYVDPSAGRTVARIAWLAVAVPVLIPVLVTLGPFITARIKQAAGVSFPATCGVNEQMEISGATFSGTGTLVTTEVNCKITIRDSKLSGDVVVKSNGNTTITIQNSTLEGKRAALELGTNDHVRVSASSTIKGADIAIDDSGANLDVVLEDSRVEGGAAAVHGSVNTSIAASRSEITSRDAAVEVGTNGKLKLMQANVHGGTGVVGGWNLEINADHSTLRGEQKGAIRGEGNTKVRLRNKSSVVARRVGIEGNNGLEVTVEDSTVDAADTGIRGHLNAKVGVSKQGRVKGAAVAISAEDNFELTADEGNIESSGTAVQADTNARIDLEASTVRGNVSSFSFKRPPSLFSVKNTTVSGPQNVPKGR